MLLKLQIVLCTYVSLYSDSGSFEFRTKHQRLELTPIINVFKYVGCEVENSVAAFLAYSRAPACPARIQPPLPLTSISYLYMLCFVRASGLPTPYFQSCFCSQLPTVFWLLAVTNKF